MTDHPKRPVGRPRLTEPTKRNSLHLADFPPKLQTELKIQALKEGRHIYVIIQELVTDYLAKKRRESP